jgi:hypothetical protein
MRTTTETPAAYPPMAEIFPCLKRAQAATAETEEPSSLKRDAADDLKKRAVWFNDLEFAGYHDINGSQILCLFDKYESALASMDSGHSTNKGAVVFAGIQTDLYLLFIRADEYNGSPRAGQEIRVDGRKFYIDSSMEYEGVYEITLRAGAAR